jgi:hypothetical protein
MKKSLIPWVTAFFLVGCDGQAKTDLVEQLRLKFEQDKELADYQISAEEMSECVGDKITKKIEGFPGSPKRNKIINAYTKLVRVDPNEDFRPTLKETAEIFGSVGESHQAAGSITMANFECVGELVTARPREGDKG